jgi:hypothetical protein
VRELLSAERRNRLQNPVVRPAVVFVEQLNIISSHRERRIADLCLGNLTLPRAIGKNGDVGCSALVLRLGWDNC